MALNKNPTFVNKPRLSVAALSNASATDLVDLIEAGLFGNKVTGLFASGEDTATRSVQVVLFRDPTEYVLVTVSVPADAGKLAGTPPVDLLTTELRAMLPVDGDGQPYLFLESGDILQVRVLSAVTATEQVSVFAVHGDFNDE